MEIQVFLNIGVIIGVIVIIYFMRHIICGFLGLYRIVPVNEAHIRIKHNSKDVFSARTKQTAYWYIPFVTKLHKLPLSNLAIPVNDIKLNDSKMAKFVCDIMCFVNIKDIELAVERLSLSDFSSKTHEMGFDFQRLSEDLRAIMESIGRTVTTKQSILDIYMNRQALDEAITKEVTAVFPKWGIELVDLELKDIKDAPQSSIIADIERKVAAEIKRDAEIKVAETTKESELAKAVNEETYRKRQIEKDREIALAEQEKDIQVQKQTAMANEQTVEARRKLEVGNAEVEKQVQQQKSEGEKIKLTIEAEGTANKTMTVGKADAEIVKVKKIAEAEGEAGKIKLLAEADANKIKITGEANADQTNKVGNAEANVIKAKKIADAEGTTKLAEAMKLFNDAATTIKMIETQKEILLGKYNALAQTLSKADIKWILSGSNAQKFFGLNLDAEGGANFNQFLEESGISIEKIADLLKNNDKTSK